jgi:hypothetical protein
MKKIVSIKQHLPWFSMAIFLLVSDSFGVFLIFLSYFFCLFELWKIHTWMDKVRFGWGVKREESATIDIKLCTIIIYLLLWSQSEFTIFYCSLKWFWVDLWRFINDNTKNCRKRTMLKACATCIGIVPKNISISRS